MGSAVSREGTSKHKDKDHGKYSSASGNSVNSVGSCSLHLDNVSENDSNSSVGFDKVELNNDRPVTVPSIQPNAAREDSSQSVLNDNEVSNRTSSPVPSDKFLQKMATETKISGVLPPINSGTSSIPKQTQSTDEDKPYGFSNLRNADILCMKRRSDHVWPINLERKNIENITEQAKIIDDLNREGLIGRGRSPQIGVAKDRSGGTEYTLTFDTPKRHLPRLLPINTEKKKDNVYRKPPWEREILFSDNHHSENQESKHLQKSLSNPTKLKIKMMNLDLV